MLDSTHKIPDQKSRTVDADAIDLSQFNTVFCDSCDALQAAFASGVSRAATILTRSPALLVRNDINVVSLDDRMPASRQALDEFYLAGDRFIETCLGILSANEKLTPYARLISRQVWQWELRAMCAAFLLETDLTEPRLIIETGAERLQAMRFAWFPWKQLLATNPLARTLSVGPISSSSGRHAVTEPLRLRLGVRGHTHAVWRIFNKVWDTLPRGWGFGTVYYIKENEIVRDVAVQFALRGFRVARLHLLEGQPASADAEKLADLATRLLGNPLRSRFAPIAPLQAIESAKVHLKDQIATEIATYDATKSYLADFGNELFREDKNNLVLANFPGGGATAALSDYTNRHGIVFAAGQHGITREILEAPQNKIVYENLYTPYLLTFTSKGEEVSNKQPFALPHHRCHTVGIPRDYYRSGRSRSRTRDASRGTIVYAQTHDRVGAFFNGTAYKNDFERFQAEARFFERVIARIRHPILFKPYPGSSYLDIDPIFDVLKKIQNVAIDQTGYDLRFLLSGCRAVIANGATSTLAWCMLSGKPVIYIDPAVNGSRLLPEVRTIFQNSATYFDQKSSSFFDDIRSYLEQPIEFIEQTWSKTRWERNRALEPYFGNMQTNPGRAGYRWLRQQMALLNRQRRESPTPANNLTAGRHMIRTETVEKI